MQDLPPLGESGSELSHLITESRNVSEVKKLSDDNKKHWLKAPQKEIKILNNNQNFLVQEPEKYEPVTPLMNFCKSNIQSDGSLDKLKLGMVFRVDLQNKELVGDTWSPKPP